MKVLVFILLTLLPAMVVRADCGKLKADDDYEKLNKILGCLDMKIADLQSRASSGESSAASDQANGRLAVVLPPAAGAAEKEPNDLLTDANQIARGKVYAGRIDSDRNDKVDWYVIPTDDIENQEMRVQIRSLEGDCLAYIYDAMEEQLTYGYCNKSGGSVNIKFFHKAGDYIFVKVGFSSNISGSTAYEIMVQ